MPCSDASAPSDPEASLGSSATPANSSHIPWAQPDPSFGDFALFIDSMSMSYANSLSALFVDQPFLSFSPSPLFGALDPQPSCAQWQNPNAVPSDMVTKRTSAPHLFDEFSSTFPSFEPPSSAKTRQEPWKITQLVWDHLLAEIQNCISVIPPEFSLPSRHTMTRYTATYFSGFHRHLPFLHVPTFSPAKCPIELILAMAAIGAQSNFDNDNAVMFFRTSHAIILERLRYRKAELCKRSFPMGDGSSIELRLQIRLPLPEDCRQVRPRIKPPLTNSTQYLLYKHCFCSWQWQRGGIQRPSTTRPLACKILWPISCERKSFWKRRPRHRKT